MLVAGFTKLFQREKIEKWKFGNTPPEETKEETPRKPKNIMKIVLFR